MIFPLAILGALTLFGFLVVLLAWAAAKLDQPRQPRTLLPRAEWMRRRRLGLDIGPALKVSPRQRG